MTIHDEKSKRIKWRTGVVVGLTRGRDGKCRRARLRLCNGNHIDRPVQRLFPLEIQATAETEVGTETTPDDEIGSDEPEEEECATSSGEEDNPLRGFLWEYVGNIQSTRVGRTV